RHKETRHALLGTTLQSFGYDDAGRLETVTNVDGLVTHLLRDADGAPTAIVGPYGQATTLALGPDGYLASVANPAGE
ncbi:RHS repeat domain-containing protein, partial [Bacillus altitudinis]|uniref:RHS repeat domain-containing protein n=1 Tax=Bacillus altitudinis TaxID=293387 RepID=UPI002F939D6D